MSIFQIDLRIGRLGNLLHLRSHVGKRHPCKGVDIKFYVAIRQLVNASAPCAEVRKRVVPRQIGHHGAFIELKHGSP